MIKINFNKNTTVNVIWQIFKCHSDNREDFSRADVYVLLVGTKNRIPLEVSTKDDGTLHCTIPCDISNDVYSLKAIWRKNFKEDHLFEDYSHCEDFHHIHHRIGLCPYGWAVAEVDDIMYVTPYEPEATTDDSEVNIRLKSEVATYGYDGLDAYELAITKGETAEEIEWLEAYEGKMQKLQEVYDNVSALTSLNKREILTKGEYLNKSQSDNIDDDCMYLIKDVITNSIAEIYFGKLKFNPEHIITPDHPIISTDDSIDVSFIFNGDNNIDEYDSDLSNYVGKKLYAIVHGTRYQVTFKYNSTPGLSIFYYIDFDGTNTKIISITL